MLDTLGFLPLNCKDSIQSCCHRTEEKQEHQTRGQKETGKKEAQRKEVSLGLFTSESLYLHTSCAATWTDVGFWMSVCNSEPPTVPAALAELMAADCRFLPYMVTLSSRLSAFQSRFLAAHHWLKLRAHVQ